MNNRRWSARLGECGTGGTPHIKNIPALKRLNNLPPARRVQKEVMGVATRCFARQRRVTHQPGVRLGVTPGIHGLENRALNGRHKTGFLRDNRVDNPVTLASTLQTGVFLIKTKSRQ